MSHYHDSDIFLSVYNLFFQDTEMVIFMIQYFFSDNMPIINTPQLIKPLITECLQNPSDILNIIKNKNLNSHFNISVFIYELIKNNLFWETLFKTHQHKCSDILLILKQYTLDFDDDTKNKIEQYSNLYCIDKKKSSKKEILKSSIIIKLSSIFQNIFNISAVKIDQGVFKEIPTNFAPIRNITQGNCNICCEENISISKFCKCNLQICHPCFSKLFFENVLSNNSYNTDQQFFNGKVIYYPKFICPGCRKPLTGVFVFGKISFTVFQIEKTTFDPIQNYLTLSKTIPNTYQYLIYNYPNFKTYLDSHNNHIPNTWFTLFTQFDKSTTSKYIYEIIIQIDSIKHYDSLNPFDRYLKGAFQLYIHADLDTIKSIINLIKTRELFQIVINSNHKYNIELSSIFFDFNTKTINIH